MTHKYRFNRLGYAVTYSRQWNITLSSEHGYKLTVAYVRLHLGVTVDCGGCYHFSGEIQLVTPKRLDQGA